MKKIICITLLFAALVFSTMKNTAAVSAWGNFTVNLPKNQGDAEVSAIAYGGGNYMTVNITSISSGYTAVRAWAEKPSGTNLTNVNRLVGLYSNNLCTYFTKQTVGKNVVLNLDNPVHTTAEPTVKGKWTPN